MHMLKFYSIVGMDKVTEVVSVSGRHFYGILVKLLFSCLSSTNYVHKCWVQIVRAQMAPFVPRQRKHRVRHRLEKQDGCTKSEPDSNATEILPDIKTEEKRKALRYEIHGQQRKISSKKQKRLDKYIVNL